MCNILYSEILRIHVVFISFFCTSVCIFFLRRCMGFRYVIGSASELVLSLWRYLYSSCTLVNKKLQVPIFSDKVDFSNQNQNRIGPRIEPCGTPLVKMKAQSFLASPWEVGLRWCHDPPNHTAVGKGRGWPWRFLSWMLEAEIEARTLQKSPLVPCCLEGVEKKKAQRSGFSQKFNRNVTGSIWLVLQWVTICSDGASWHTWVTGDEKWWDGSLPSPSLLFISRCVFWPVGISLLTFGL